MRLEVKLKCGVTDPPSERRNLSLQHGDYLRFAVLALKDISVDRSKAGVGHRASSAGRGVGRSIC